MKNESINENPLGYAKIDKLIIKFAIPSIIAMMVSAIYNIVDQLFIGNAVGTNGNAATNIAFPLAMMCTAIALMFGIGGASNFNLAMGKGENEDAPYYVGNSVSMLIFGGLFLFLITEIFLSPMLKLFGSPANVLQLAKQYVGVSAIGFPFMIITIGGGHLIRADGSPKMTMICNLSGAIINVGLDALFVLVFRWGMYGAAAATVIGQVFSGIFALVYIYNYKTVKISKKHLRVKKKYVLRICALGMASCFNQIAMMTVQIVLNNLLKYYGARSIYGNSIPIACAGIVTKVSQLYLAVVIGLAQGSQPIESFNYGAKKYDRVKGAYKIALYIGALVSVVAFLVFQLFPRQILSMFGGGESEYYEFGVNYFRIYLFFTWLNCVQIITSTFFTSIGKAYKGTFLSLTRQIIFLLPLLFILSFIWGINGILYAAPIADLVSFLITTALVVYEFRHMVEGKAHG